MLRYLFLIKFQAPDPFPVQELKQHTLIKQQEQFQHLLRVWKRKMQKEELLLQRYEHPKPRPAL